MKVKLKKKFNKNDPDWVPRQHEGIKCEHCDASAVYVTDKCWLCHKPFKTGKKK